MTKPNDPGFFISFEGIDGAGKSTHLEAFAKHLRGRYQGKEIVLTREPGGTPLGEELRKLLLNQAMHIETEALLMFAARREHLAVVIEPALQAGKIVISDRFTDASFAYQGGGRGLSLEKLNALEELVQGRANPVGTRTPTEANCEIISPKEEFLPPTDSTSPTRNSSKGKT